MTNFDMPEGANELEGTMQDGVQLPFQACYFYVTNGKPDLEGLGADNIKYSGGWSVDADEADSIIRKIPDALFPYDNRNREGGEYKTYGARALFIAPIAKRSRWTDRSHLQVLSMVGVVAGGEMYNLGVHVLSAKGYQTKFLSEAIREWERGAGKLLTGETLPNYFWHAVGTFDDVDFKEVGSNATSYITPMVLQSREIDMELLKKRFVGKDIGQQMVDANRVSQEWLAEWDKKEETQAQVDVYAASAVNEDYAPPMPEEDDFLF